MSLTLKEVGTSAVVGAVDIASEEIDTWRGYTKPLQNVKDWERIAWVGGGLALNYMGQGVSRETSKTIVLSGLPLLEKTIYTAVTKMTGLKPFKGRGMGLQLVNAGNQGAPANQQVGTAVRWG